MHSLLSSFLPSPFPLPSYHSTLRDRLLSPSLSSSSPSSVSTPPLVPTVLAASSITSHPASPAPPLLVPDEPLPFPGLDHSLSAAVSSSPPPSSSAPSPSSSSQTTTDWSEVSLPRFCFWMGLFSITENALFYPFWLVKTREQSDRSTNYSPLAFARKHIAGVLRKEGPRGLYRGFVASSVISLPAYGIYSGVYTWAKEQLGYGAHSNPSSPAASFAARHPVLVSYAAPFVAGLVADVASILLYVPGDVISQRLQLLNSPDTSFLQVCRRILKEDGPLGFFRGFNATLLTSAIASAVWWLVYEQCKTRLYHLDEQRRARLPPKLEKERAVSSGGLWAAVTEVNRAPQMMAGFIAGTVTSTVVNPLDVVKTRLQVQGATAGLPPSSSTQPKPKPYRSFVHGLRSVYAEEGVRGFARGLVPKLISRGPLSALSSLMYEVVLFLSREDRDDRQREASVKQSQEQLK